MTKNDNKYGQEGRRIIEDRALGQDVSPADQGKQTGGQPAGPSGKEKVAVDSLQADHHEDEAQNKSPAAVTTADGKASNNFITDIEPFLFGRPITYVDVGANVGAVMHEILNSSVNVRQAHLVEPNPQTFAALQQAKSGFAKVSHLSCHNVAVSAARGKVTMRDEGTMTHIVAARRKDTNLSERVFEVETVTLDELARQCEISHINLLKVDVEGHELAVFEGARQLLEAQRVDIIYVEAGLDPESNQQAYYRAIEDALNIHGYRLFKIYEQKNEWLDDNPFLRRVNLAFMSTRFANANPYKVTQQLFEARKGVNALTAQLKVLQEELSRKEATAAQQIAALERERDRDDKVEKVATLAQVLETTQAEVAALTEQLDTLSRKHAETLAERDRTQEAAQAEAATLRTELDKRSEEIAALIRNADAESHQYAETLAERDRTQEAAQAEAATLRTELDKRSEEITSLTCRAEELQHHNDSLLQSTSWKITAPARKVVTILRGKR